MAKIAMRQTILGLLVVLNLSLTVGCIYLLRSEATAAVLFCLAFLGVSYGDGILASMGTPSG